MLMMMVGNAVAMGDVIELKDGRVLSGTMRRDAGVGGGNGGGVTITTTDADGTKTTVATTADQIVRVTLTGTGEVVTPEKAAEAEWTRVAVQVGKAMELATIIELHQKFLEKFPDQAISASVRTSLEEYQRLARGVGGGKAVKFRGRWMPAVQADVMMRTWDEEARPAMDFYRAGKMRECLEVAAKLAAANDQNSTAITLAGLAAYRLNQLQTAREYFKKLGQVDPSTPLAENNLAVIAAQQNNPMESLRHYLKALQAAPDNRMVLDNTIEAMVNFTGDRTSSAFMELARQFNAAEPRMEKEMATRELYRWGSTWVTLDTYGKLAAYRQAAQKAMEQLDRAYQEQQQAIAGVVNQITRAGTDYNAILSAVNSLNQLIGPQYGPTVGDLILRRDAMMKDMETIRAQKSALESHRDQLVAGLSEFPIQAQRLKEAMALSDASLYPGIQRMMQVGEDRDPPPPLPVAVAKIPGFTPSPVPGAGAVKAAPLSVSQLLQQRMTDTYQQLGTPLGLPMPAVK